MRTAPRTYALPYPAVFDAVVAVLGARRPVSARERDRGRVTIAGRLRTLTVYVGAVGTTRTSIVVDVAGPLGTRKLADRTVEELDRYLAYYYRPAS
jgi:hypothetical protein